MADTTCTIEGNLTGDPELTYTGGGRPLVKFGVAVNSRFKDAGGGQQERTDFFNCEAWQDLAENIAESLSKGTRVLIQGTLKLDQWEHEGQKRSMVKVTVNAIGPSLRWATASVTRTERKTSTQEPAMAGAPAGDGDGYDEEPF